MAPRVRFTVTAVCVWVVKDVLVRMAMTNVLIIQAVGSVCKCMYFLRK